MKRRIIRILVSNRITWKIISILNKLVYRFIFERELIEWEKRDQQRKIKEAPIKKIFQDLVVKGGFFKGMKYPDFVACGSSIYPKLLGSYESELTPVIEKIVSNRAYSEIIDVGCAEGFYAIGLAKRMPWTKVYAYDIDPLAIEACNKMAQVNGVNDRLVLGNFCSPSTLKEFRFTNRGLIICDCEGYEIELFRRENLVNLSKCDILIELHDGKNERISPYIYDLFKETHDKEIIQSVNCFTKASTYPELKNLSLDELQICLEERGGIMEWAFFTSKKN